MNDFDVPLECSEGWWPLIAEIDKKMKLMWPNYKIDQIKEKFGTLRFYWHISLEDENWLAMNEDIRNTIYEIMSDIVYAAEAKSAYVCEECGKRGSLRRGGWVRTLCARHAIEQGYEIEDWEKTTYAN